MNRHIRLQVLERTLDDLRGRYGEHAVRCAMLYTDPALSGFCPKTENLIHPEPFMKG